MKVELYTSTWCSACKTVKPIVESLENVEVEMVDVEQQTKRAVDLGIRNIPVIRFTKDNLEVGRLVGNKTKEEIQQMLDTLI